MENKTARCPYCGADMTVIFVDVGTKMEPTMMMGLTCDCDDWLEREMEASVEYSMQYGEVI